ncbi:MAG: hypothetical protein KAI71_01050 [Candidatus Pacebacteria bacterium]|nr:hypothetical protein [Candidatus Paceibacterota bacterium]
MSYKIHLSRKGSPNFLKLIVVVIAIIYFAQYIIDPFHFGFLYVVNLVIHEAGHVFFMFFGELLYASGGTIFQLSVPFIFIAYFCFKKEFFSAFILLFWLGQNFINVAVYMGDAVERELPLLGGNNVRHDWYAIFSYLNILQLTDILSTITYSIGVFIIIVAAVLSFCSALKVSLRFKNKY